MERRSLMMGDDYHQQLLHTLKSVVEGLLSCQVANVWNVYGGLSRIHSIFERILKHEFKIFKQNGEEDCWMFIEGLNWLQPSLATSPTPVSPNSPPPHPHTDKAMIWLHNSLETHSLSEKLVWLVSDKSHLEFCYGEKAFLRHPQYVEAALICLRAVEQNQLALLTEIHPTLYLSQKSLRAREKFHRRCSSFPEAVIHKPPPMWSSKSVDERSEDSIKSCRAQELTVLHNNTALVVKQAEVFESKIAEETPVGVICRNERLCKIKPWQSLPNLTNELLCSSASIVHHRRTRTVPSSPARYPEPFLFSPKIDYDEGTDAVETLQSHKFRRKDKPVKRAALSTSSGSGESVETVKTYCRPDRRKKKSFIEDGGGASVKPMSTGACFPQPKAGEGLISFLSSTLSANWVPAELDRENAHFSVAEAIIAAIEHVKCSRWERIMDEAVEESDEEIRDLKQRIRVRRRIKQREDKNKSLLSSHFWPASHSDNTATDQSFSPRSTDDDDFSADSISTDGVDDMEMDQVTPSNLENINKSGLSLSMASLYSEADLGRTVKIPPQSNKRSATLPLPNRSVSPATPNAVDHDNSAELVALSLLSKFEDRHLPKASDLQWLVSEKDAPQQLLPLPDSIVAEEQDLDGATPLRGTTQWAPPRPQIIFTPQPPPKRKELLLKQNMRCAGCGMRVAQEYADRFRYCEYLAKYFCTGCHANKQALIPGRILAKWDFNRYSVSNFSYNLLEQMQSDPLFDIRDINPELYKRVKFMDRTRRLRLQLYFMKDFILTCKFTDQLSKALKREPTYIFMEIDKYSIFDLSQVKSKELLLRLSRLVENIKLHIAECPLCQARGFICERCRSNDVIFPWQFESVARCDKCFSCQHTNCLRKASSSPSCLKCYRIELRKS